MKIWDNYRKKWLEPMVIFFDKKGMIWRITACDPGADTLSDGWYDFHGNYLNNVAIDGTIKFNTNLLPQ